MMTLRYIKLLMVLAVVLAISGCAEVPLNKDGEVVVGKDTSAGIDDIGVGHISNKF